MTAGRRPGSGRRLTDADLVTLTVLADGTAHGHGIWSRLASHDVEDWATVSRAQVYYSLGKLADQKLIREADAGHGETGRERRNWRITPEGRRALSTALASSHWAVQRVVPPFLTWVALAELARPATRRKMLGERRAFLDAEIDRERATLVELRRQPADTRGVKVAISMVQHVILEMKLEREWLEELEHVLA